jgi:CHAT domain-containing protein/tetratricopeptide (TPR) repeat protein
MPRSKRAPWSILLATLVVGGGLLRCERGSGSGPGGGASSAAPPRPPAAAKAGPTPQSPQPPQRHVPVRHTYPLGPAAATGERSLAAGDVDTYEIDLDSGQYLRVVADQHGIDVAVDVLDPKLHRLFRADSPNDVQGPEIIPLVAGQRGRYRLAIEARRAIPAGTYRIRIEALRPATDGDRRLSLGLAAYYEARELDKDETKPEEEFWRTAATYEQAARLLDGTGERQRQGEAVYYLGCLYLDHRRPADAQPVLEQAARLFTSLGNQSFLALSLNELGRSDMALDEPGPAAAAFDAALDAWRRQRDLAGEASTLQNLGVLQQLGGQRWKALGSLQESLRLWQQQARYSSGWANTLSGLGWVYESLGERQRAIEAYLQMRDVARALPDTSSMVVALTQLGNEYALAGQPQLASPLLHQALDLLAALPPSPRVTRQRATALNGLGVSLRSLEDFAAAKAAYAEAQALYRALGEPREEAIAWINLGQIANETEHPDEARGEFAQALDIAQRFADLPQQARAFAGLADSDVRGGQLAAAQDRAEKAVAAIESLRVGAARRDLQASFMAANQGAYDLLVRVLMERHRQQPIAGYDQEALARSEQGRDRGLLDLLRPPRPGSDPSLLRLRLQILADIERRTADERNLAAPPDQVEASRRALLDLFDRLHEVDLRLRGGQPPGPPTAGSPPPPIDAAAIDRLRRSLLDKNTILLEYHLDQPASYLWAVSADAVQGFELPDRRILQPLIDATLRRLTAAEGEDTPATGAAGAAETELSRWLLGRVASSLGRKRLLIAADGPLRYLPFDALPDPSGGGILLLRHEIATVPSLSVLAALRARADLRQKKAGRRIGVFADPVFDATDPRVAVAAAARSKPKQDPQEEFLARLVHSRDEATTIESLAGGDARLALDFAASRQRALGGGLADFDILHFATHGVWRTDAPEASALVLSRVDPTGRPVDGYLPVPDIEILDLRAELVVLSACHTVGTTDSREETGLPEAFFAAGADRVLLTLWSIGDDSAAALMREFYRHLLGDKPLAPAAALRAAQLAVRARPEWAAPRYWAGFVLSGISP